MRRLIPSPYATRARDERGAAAVIVAVSLVVVFGMAAFVIDVGALYQEKRELQNGADFAALAVAKDCALGTCGDTTGTAESLVDPNANDGTSTVDSVDVNLGARTVTVGSSTSEPGGGSKVAYRFAQIFGKDGDTVRASATATYGPLGSGPAIPLTISKCEWDNATGGTPDNLPSASLNLTFHDGANTEPCNPGGSGSDVPGGFGWLDVNDRCEARPDVRNGAVWVGSAPGSSPPLVCDPSDFSLVEDVMIPVFDDTAGQGQRAEFRIIGYAGFRITGFQLLQGNPGWTEGATCSVPNNTTLLTAAAPGGGKGNGGGGGGGGGGTGGGGGAGSDQVCLTGQFVKFFEVDAEGGGPSVPNLGAQTAWLVQ
ncbi:MAG TPA: pilus assembly protein TadG-related protein [Acidimicrobiia bacterium]|nr:pilus assembly protein TadG-related protein [Acidimicrobiia bacterium]